MNVACIGMGWWSDVLADATIRLTVVEGLLAPLFRRPEPAVFVV